MRRVETELAASIDRSAIAALSMLERDETVKGMLAGGARTIAELCGLDALGDQALFPVAVIRQNELMGNLATMADNCCSQGVLFASASATSRTCARSRRYSDRRRRLARSDHQPPPVHLVRQVPRHTCRRRRPSNRGRNSHVLLSLNGATSVSPLRPLIGSARRSALASGFMARVCRRPCSGAVAVPPVERWRSRRRWSAGWAYEHGQGPGIPDRGLSTRALARLETRPRCDARTRRSLSVGCRTLRGCPYRCESPGAAAVPRTAAPRRRRDPEGPLQQAAAPGIAQG
jgi:hypothetical protein